MCFLGMDINVSVVKANQKIKVENMVLKNTLVYADQECITQIVSNFLTNAIKHCEEKNGEKKILIKAKQLKDKVRIFIYNSGENISEDYVDKIWGRFYKIDESRNREKGGSGIGLAIVKAIMNNYGNKYGVKNLKNGVEFYCDINIDVSEQ